MISLFVLQSLSAQEISLGAGSYNLTPPVINGHTPKVPRNSSNQNTYPKVSPNFNQPIQTNDWWSSLIYKYYQNNTFLWEIHSWKLYAHPLAFVANRYGLDVQYPTNTIVENYYSMTDAKYQNAFSVQDFTIGVNGMDLGVTDTTKVDAYGDWHVTPYWADGSGKTMKATIAHGSPYVYVEKSGEAEAYIRFFYNPSINHNLGNIIGITVQGHHYGIFAPTGSTWNTNDTYEHDENAFVANSPNLNSRKAYTSTLNGKDYFSIALLPDATLNTLQDYAQYAFAFIDDTKVLWNYSEDNATLKTTYTSSTIVKEGTESQTLQALYPHQWKNTGLGNINTSYTYSSPRGEMKVHKGNSFSTALINPGIIPTVPSVLDTNATTELYAAIDHEMNALNAYNTNQDTYRYGKRLARQSDLVFVADQVGHTVARDHFISGLKTELEDWFDAPSGESNYGYFYYDSNWNTLIGYPANYGTDTQVNDHHFHYGYFIKAAATIAQFDPNWAADHQWGSMIQLLIKDVSNWDRNDTQFPFLRTYDPYAGHSWANGHANFHFGNEQESSSEAMNYAAWVYLFGLNTNNDEIRDLGIFLYLNEAEAIKKYWFDEDGDVFPSDYDYISATRVWGNGADKVLGSSFELESEYQLGINTCPIQGPLLYLGTNLSMVENNHLEAANQGDGIGDLWEDIMWGHQAIYDPTSALSDYNAHTTNGFYNDNLPGIPTVTNIYNPFSHSGLAPSQIYYWLNNLNTLGTLRSDITADYSSALVFQNGTDLFYVINNPSNNPMIVTFSDGQKVNAPAETIHVWEGSTLPPSIKPSFSAIFNNGPRLVLALRLVDQKNYSHYEIEKLNKEQDFILLQSVFEEDLVTGSFHLLDPNPLKGWNIYRVKYYHIDGSISYSDTEKVWVRKNNIQVQITPNPVEKNKSIQIEITHTTDQEFDISFFHISGKMIYQKTISNDIFSLDTSNLEAGIYCIYITSKSGNISQEKIIIF